MRTEKEIQDKMAESLDKARGHRPSRAMYWQQQAGILRWVLEDPAPVITDEGRKRAKRRANAEGKPFYLWATDVGTHASMKHPNRRCEVVEPKIKPRKRKKFLYGPSEVRKAN